MQEVLVIWIKDQNGHQVPLNQSPIQNKPNSLQFYEDWESWRILQKKNLKLEQYDSWGSRKEIVFIKVQAEEVSTDVESSSSYPEGPAKIINEGGYTQ